MVHPISRWSTRGSLGIAVLIICLMITSSNLNKVTVPCTNHYSSSSIQADERPPDIFHWGHSEVIADEPFQIWANVSDLDSGIHNVTAIAKQEPGNRSYFLMDFNGSLYVTDEALLETNHTYRLSIRAYDNSMNVQNSYPITVDLRILPTSNDKDPFLTMPYVVGSTIALLAVIILIAFYYSKGKKEST